MVFTMRAPSQWWRVGRGEDWRQEGGGSRHWLGQSGGTSSPSHISREETSLHLPSHCPAAD